MKKFLPVIILVVLGIVCRLVPHLPNFAPIGAMAIFGALYLPKKWAIIMPMAALFVSDMVIGFYSFPVMLAVYLSFAMVGAIGLLVRKNKKVATIFGATLLGSGLFFLVTNTAVWMFGTIYAHTLEGLLNCFYMALPFFRNSLAGDIFYVGVLVGGYEFALWYQANKMHKLATAKKTI